MRSVELGGDARLAAGREDHGVPRGEGARGVVVGLDAHRALAHEAGVAAHHADARGLGPLDLGGVVVVGDERVAPREHAVPVEPRGDDAAEVVSQSRHVDRAQQRLAGHARVVRALPAQQVTLHDDRGEVRALDRVLRGVLSHRAAADHDHVHRLLRC